MSKLNDELLFRRRAAEARTEALATNDPIVRKQILLLAGQYAAIGRSLKVMAAISPVSSARVQTEFEASMTLVPQFTGRLDDLEGRGSGRFAQGVTWRNRG